MTTGCKAITALFSLLLPLAPGTGFGQSLEDKLEESRAKAALAAQDPALVDSLLKQRNNQVKPKTEKIGREADTRLTETNASDQVLAAPGAADSLFDSTAKELASLTPRLKKNQPEPRRYEQRIFRNVDRSAFASARGAASREHALGPGDEIRIFLWGDREKEYAVTLNPDGKIFVEGVGLVPLAGSNLDQAEKKLKERMSRIYSGIGRGTTHVEVQLGQAGPIRVFVLGEVHTPGGFVFTGNTSVLSAMYFAQGPTDIGTVRNIRLTRGGAKYRLDLYKFLIRGEALSPAVLLDGDVLFADRADILVEIEGEVGRPAVYELARGEGVKELLEFAGGLNPTAAAHKLSLQRIDSAGKIVYLDLASPREYLSGSAAFPLADGDRILVERSSEISDNFITISGPVKYPGTYESKGLQDLRQLVQRAGGLREDAYLGRVHIMQFRPDGSSTMQAYSMDTLAIESIPVRPRDYVVMYSQKDMYLPDSVHISGAVFSPGTYEFRAGMTEMDLIMQAGGFLPNYERGRLLVFRGDLRERKVEQITLNIAEGLAKTEKGLKLKPNDYLHVPIDPMWYKKEVVTLEGLFKYPGQYALLYPGEKVASVIQRAGGFKENAYVQGGRFYRNKGGIGKVGVDIDRALRNPGSKANIPFTGGDSIFIPERSNTVKVIGEVGFETSVLFKEGASASYYIEKAGGFTRRSEKNRVVVQYANGETSRDGTFNRKPDAGSVILVPQGPEPEPVDWFAGINAILGTMGVATALILSVQAIQSR